MPPIPMRNGKLTRFIGFFVTEEMAAALEAEAKNAGVSKSEIVRTALGSYLSAPDAPAAEQEQAQ